MSGITNLLLLLLVACAGSRREASSTVPFSTLGRFEIEQQQDDRGKIVRHSLTDTHSKATDARLFFEGFERLSKRSASER